MATIPPTVPLTQAQLEAQNAAAGKTQLNAAPAPIGGTINSPSPGMQQAGVTVSGPISADTLHSTDTPMNIPSPTTPDYSTAGILAQIQAKSAAEQAASQGIDETTRRIQEAMATEGTRGAVQNSLEADQGIPDLKKHLKEINDQILGVNDAAFAATNAAEDRQAPTFAITGEQAAIDRQKAVRTYALSAASASLQGSIALANDYVTKALAAQFDPIEAQMKYYTDVALPLARDKMTDAQKAKADEISVKLAEHADQVATQKSDKAAAYSVLTAAGQYAKNFTPTPEYPTITTALNAMQAAKDGAEATKIAVATGLVAAADNWSEPYKLGGDYVQKNNKTGEIRTAVNVPTASTTGTFSPTQSNTGAANAGIPIEQFSSLTADDKNYFVNGYSGFTAALKQVQAGTATLADLKTAIDEAPLSQTAKDILYKKAGITAASGKSGGGSAGNFFSGAWNFLKGIAGF